MCGRDLNASSRLPSSLPFSPFPPPDGLSSAEDAPRWHLVLLDGIFLFYSLVGLVRWREAQFVHLYLGPGSKLQSKCQLRKIPSRADYLNVSWFFPIWFPFPF